MLRSVLIRRNVQLSTNWYKLSDFSTTEADILNFKQMKDRDTDIQSILKKPKSSSTEIDWSSWSSKISHSDLVKNLKEFHQDQVSRINSMKFNTDETNELSKDIIQECVTSVKESSSKSDEIVRNGAKALYISYNNPPVDAAEPTEWIDTDQYWAAYVEKHMHYANHLNVLSEDPESKEYENAIHADLLRKWDTWDGRNVTRHNNKHLYQRPSYEYYDLYRSTLVEHMIYYLVKSGGDFRIFPELLKSQDFSSIYNYRFKYYSVAGRRRHQQQLKNLSRSATLDLAPGDMEHDGSTYYEKLLNNVSLQTEYEVARLMGDYMFLSPGIPITNQAELVNICQSGMDGKFYSIGEDVSAIFFRPAEDSLQSDPINAFNNNLDYLRLCGIRLPPSNAQVLDNFHELLSSRKEGLDGKTWFNLPNESLTDAFLRRLDQNDPSRSIFEHYTSDLNSRWESAVEITNIEDLIKNITKIEELNSTVSEPLDSIANSCLLSEVLNTREELDHIQKMSRDDFIIAMANGDYYTPSRENDANEIYSEILKSSGDIDALSEQLNSHKLVL